MSDSRTVGLTRRELLTTATASSILLAGGSAQAKPDRRVVVWSEGTAKSSFYPNDVNGAIAEGLKPLKGWDIHTAGIEEPDQGLPSDLLASTSVLIWRGHKRHGDVKDELVTR